MKRLKILATIIVALFISNVSWGQINVTAGLGSGNTVTGSNASSLGTGNTSSGSRAFSSGINNTASNYYTTAMGRNCTASGSTSTAIGRYCTASGAYTTALGEYAQATANYAHAFGRYAYASSTYSIAIGTYVEASTNSYAMAIGRGVSSASKMTNTIASSLAIGFNSTIPTFFVEGGSGAGTLGQIGIGTTSPNALLDVRGDAIFNEDGDDNDFRIEGDALTHLLFVDAHENTVSIGTSATPHSFNVDGTSYLKGHVGIAGYPDATYELYVWGDAWATEGWHETSDIRYKKNIETINNALDKVISLRGVSFDFRTDEFKDMNFSKGKKYGFIAQELINILPEIAKQNDKGYYALNYTGVIPVLAEAIKEQQKIIENQNNKIENIEKEIALLKETIALLNNTKNTSKDKAELIKH